MKGFSSRKISITRITLKIVLFLAHFVSFNYFKSRVGGKAAGESKVGAHGPGC